MKKFEFIDITTADVAFVAYGKTLAEMFANAALAMFEVMINTKEVRHKIKQEITVSGNDMPSLMFNWLNKLIVFVDAENVVFSRFNVIVDEKLFTLKALCFGEKIDQKRHELRTVVKSATYHKMEIKKKAGLWQAQVILDI